MLVVFIIGLLLANPVEIDRPMPPVPALDTSAVEGLAPLEVARRAVGSADAGFVDRRVYVRHPMAPIRDWAGVSLYLRPEAIHPGLCAGRYLFVEMKTEPPGAKAERIRATEARWEERFRVVSSRDLRSTSDSDSLARTQRACDALKPARDFISDMTDQQGFDARSQSSAVRHALLFQTVVEAASRSGRLPFALECGKVLARWCSDPRSKLARLSSANLISTAQCVAPAVEGDCYALFVRGHPLDRTEFDDTEWRLQIITRPGSPDKPVDVTLDFWVPPVI